MVKLDIKDKKILALLIKFSRFNNSTIARNIGISRENVDYRIRRMTRKGIIMFSTIYLYLPRLFHAYFYDIFLKIEKISIEHKDEIIKKLVKNPYIVYLEECEGKWNIHSVVLGDNSKLKSVLDEIHSLCNYYLSDLIVFPVLSKQLAKRLFFLEDIEIPIIKGKGPDISLYKKMQTMRNKIIKTFYDSNKKYLQFVDLDKKDKHIISLLKEDSRMNLVSIAKELGITPNAVSYRIKKLVKEGIIAYFSSIIDFRKIGYTKANLFLNTVEINPKTKLFLNSLEKDKRTEGFTVYAGKWQYCFSFIIEDNQKFQKILYNLLEKYSDIILDYHLLWSAKEHKGVSVPDLDLYLK